MTKNNYGFFLFFLALMLVIPSAIVYGGTQENDWRVSSGFEVDNLITLVSSFLATSLFVLTIIAYKRDGRTKLVYVATAFLLFAIKGFLISSDIFFPNKGGWVDPTANFLDFAILLSFFFGILKK